MQSSNSVSENKVAVHVAAKQMVEDELDTFVKVTASAADNITGSSDVNKSTPPPSKKS